MNKQNKNIVQSLIGIIIGGVFLYFTLVGKDLESIFESIKNADIFWILMSIICLLFIYLLRALRWKILLEENNIEISTKKVFTSILLAYFINSFTPKLGELVRCTSLNLDSKDGLAKSLGSVFAERAYDLLILALGILLILIFQFEYLQNIISNIISKYTALFNYKYYLIATLILILTLAISYISKLSMDKDSKISIFISSMIKSIKQGFKIKRSLNFFVLTASIWLCLILLNYFFILSLSSTSHLSISFACIILFVGGIGWALPSPGGIGTTHFLLLQLFIAYNLNPEWGVSFGIISNGLTFIASTVFGLLAWAYHTYINMGHKTL